MPANTFLIITRCMYRSTSSNRWHGATCKKSIHCGNSFNTLPSHLVWHMRTWQLQIRTCISSSYYVSPKWVPSRWYFQVPWTWLVPHRLERPPTRSHYLNAFLSPRGSSRSYGYYSSFIFREVHQCLVFLIFHEADIYLLRPRVESLHDFARSITPV